MPENDIERTIEKYWGRKTRQLNIGDEETFQQMLQELEEQFIDPTRDTPVKTVDFVKWLDPESIIDVLKKSYPYFKYIKPRLISRMRFFAYFMISKKKNAWQAYHSLNVEDYRKLGFNGKPTYEVLREFCYERIGVKEFPIVLNWVVKETVFLLEKQGVFLGEETFQDATPVRSLKDDSDAKHSGYYKHSGYKLDVTLDAQHGVPLDYVPMEITANEGENLIPSQQHVASLGIQEEIRVVDDKYATFENIANCELNGVSLYYKIAKNWNYKEEGTPGEIKKRYQKYHQDGDFIPGADLDFMLHYLHRKEEFEAVGSYFRNCRMAEYEEHPEGYLEICHTRSRIEGDYGRLKLTTLLDDHPGRRGWKHFLLRAGMTMLSLAFAALIRVQNAVTSHLTNVTYIT